MAFKLIAVVALFGMAMANPVPYYYSSPEYVSHVSYATPTIHVAYEPKIVEIPKKEEKFEESYEHAPPHYSYSYDVHDSHTGDIKKAQESRRGDAVEGSYSFVEADGSRRIVHYTADDHHGFNAVVEKEPAKFAVKHETKHEPLHVVYPVTFAYKVESAPAHQEYHHVYHHESHEQAHPHEYHSSQQ